MEENKTKKLNIKLIIILSIVIAIFSIGLPNKKFQNDTFFNISIGNYILKNGIDMQEHFTWVKDVKYYTYSHWAFDVMISLIYNIGNFDGIYLFVICLTIFTNVSLFVLTSKRYGSPIISFIVTLGSVYFIKSGFTARSQIISFVCFIFLIYNIEQFIETKKIRYPIYMVIISIIVANFHAATWPLILILMGPYLLCGFINAFSPKGIYTFFQNFFEKKAKKYPEDSEDYKKYMGLSNDYKRYIEEIHPPVFSKVTVKKDYCFKGLIIIFIILIFTGLITPIKDVPYTYIIKSMIGDSHMEDSHKSVDYVAEMTPTTPIMNMPMIYFSIMFLGLMIFLPINIRREHLVLVLGLTLMALISVRYVYLLIFLGSFVLVELLTSATNTLMKDDIESLEKIFTHPLAIILLVCTVTIYSSYCIVDKMTDEYVPEDTYPVKPVEYIVNNLDYKNIRIFNSYDYGSYLMFNGIPVFIDSRLDVYCAEFDGCNVFRDYIGFSTGSDSYYDFIGKYDFTHFLMDQGNYAVPYMKKSFQFKEIYSDDNYILFEVLK